MTNGGGDVRGRDGHSRPSPISRARPLWLDHAHTDVETLRQPGAVALVGVGPDGRAEGLAVLNELGRALATAPVSVTEVGLAGAAAGTWQELLGRLKGRPLLYDLEALCWEPWLFLDVRRFLLLLARQVGVIALWPGRVGEGVATFSASGRRDHVRVELAGMSVLRPVPTRFPDEVPFEIERAPR
ncbi:MAG: hypothetical protein F4X12_20225 [Acidobacteriia bacterium]|nr:hypothetical protein [Terriglobia bacterium]